MSIYSEQPIEGRADLIARKAKVLCIRAADVGAQSVLDFLDAAILKGFTELCIAEKLAEIKRVPTTADVDALLAELKVEGDGGA